MYPELYHAHHLLHMEDLPFWMDLADQAGDPILELGCGTGRILGRMAAAGHISVGLDKDPKMLSYLLKELEPEATAPVLIVADMCRFNLHQRYSLIYIPCNTFSTLSETERSDCLDCVVNHLKPDGLFAFSIANPAALASLPARSGIELEEEFILPQTGNPVQVSSSWRRTRGHFRLTWYYDLLQPDGRVQRITAQADHQMAPSRVYLDELRGSGLKLKALYGDFDHSDYLPESPYFICVASR
jgi:SAM-dependent methyltransferase